jgi:NAD-dependent DNA ligase
MEKSTDITVSDLIKEEHGGTIKSSVVQGLTYLVTNKGTEDGVSSKHKKALQLGVQIINEEQFLKMINKKAEPVEKSAEIKPYNIFE